MEWYVSDQRRRVARVFQGAESQTPRLGRGIFWRETRNEGCSHKVFQQQFAPFCCGLGKLVQSM